MCQGQIPLVVDKHEQACLLIARVGQQRDMEAQDLNNHSDP